MLDEIGDEHRGRKFAIIIDEAHSGQGGRTSARKASLLARSVGSPLEKKTPKTPGRCGHYSKLSASLSELTIYLLLDKRCTIN